MASFKATLLYLSRTNPEISAIFEEIILTNDIDIYTDLFTELLLIISFKKVKYPYIRELYIQYNQSIEYIMAIGSHVAEVCCRL